VLEALIASIGNAGGVILNKLILSKHKVPVPRFIPTLFIWLAIITAIFLPKWGFVDWEQLLTAKYIILFALMIVVACIWNVYALRGIQKEEIHEFELIMLLSPLMTIIFAEIFLPAERDIWVFVAGIVASVALIATRFRHHHLKIGKTAWLTIMAMVLMSLESIIIKEILAVVSPVSLYFIRTTIIAIVFLILYRPKISKISKEVYAMTIISAIFGVVQMVLKFYGFINFGVIETTMVLILGPMMVYVYSYFYFKEKLYKRDIVAAIVVVAMILWVTFK